MNYLRIVYIEWEDSETTDGWSPIDSSQEDLPLAHSVGIFLSDDKGFVEIAHSIDPVNGNVNGRIRIPHVAIKKIRTLCQIQMKTK